MAYDHIVIGAGSAGCVLARRLVDAGRRVLLLEAGGPDTAREIHIPAAFSKLFKTAVDWNLSTVPQPTLDGRELYWPRGKLLGGCSSINAMIYIRGNRRDYDDWAAEGCDGWSYDDLLPLFRRSEDNTRGSNTHHGSGGPLAVTDLRDPNPLSRAFVEAAGAAGFVRNDDFNGTTQEGFGLHQVTQRSGRRCSASAGFLKPILGHPNLTVTTHAHVTRIEIHNGCAVGISWAHRGGPKDGESGSARCDGEIVLTSGAVHSPQLLMLSGIGPAEHLRELGVEVVADLPGVGENLQDHLATPMTWTCPKPVSLAHAEGIGSILRYLFLRRGMLTSNAGEAGGFVRSHERLDAPDLQYIFGPVYYLDHGFELPEGDGFTLGPILLQPESRGTLRLRSSDPFSAPSIDPCYGVAESDLALLVEGMRIARRIATTEPLAPFRSQAHLPNDDRADEETLRAHMRRWSETLYHPVGTCKMGIGEDAVVDPELRVRGVKGLRVADASIMPRITRGNTNAPTIVIAEKAADFLTDAT